VNGGGVPPTAVRAPGTVRPLADLGAGTRGRVVALRLGAGERHLPSSPLQPGTGVYVVEAGHGRWLHVRIGFREYSIPADLAERVLVAVADADQPARPAPEPATDAYAVLLSRLQRTSWRVRVVERTSGTVARSEWFEAEADARRRWEQLSRDADGLDPAAFRARHELP
jgi:FeoA domain